MEIHMQNRKKGFTLAELLVVVAIVSILAAISIPIFTRQLETSREATDLANVRSAYAEVMAAVMIEDTENEVKVVKLSKENNYEALAFETVACEVTTGDNPYHSGDFHLAVAKRSEVSPLIEV